MLVGIPAFNEEHSIAKVVIQASESAGEVLVVDDGSRDDTGIIAEHLGAIILRHEKNLGKGAAVRDCFEYARRSDADVLVTMDADGQHDALQIRTLVDALINKHTDVVIGARLAKPIDMPRYRWLGARALDRATGVKVGSALADSQSGFRAYSRKAIEMLMPSELGMSVDSELIKKAEAAGLRISLVPVSISYSDHDSKKNPLFHWMEVFFGIVKYVSIRHPLTFYGGSSVVAFFVSLVFGLMTLDYYQRWGRVVTNLALLSIAAGIVGFLTLFTGIILFTLITVVREKPTV